MRDLNIFRENLSEYLVILENFTENFAFIFFNSISPRVMCDKISNRSRKLKFDNLTLSQPWHPTFASLTARGAEP